MSSLLEVTDLSKTFKVRRRGKKQQVAAVRGVSFTLDESTTLGLVGESGSGKSTAARLMLRLIPADSGSVMLRGTDVMAAGTKQMRTIQRSMPMVFQDPYSSLDPTWLIGDIVTEPEMLADTLTRGNRRTRAKELIDLVGLPSSFVDRYPYELSGGQRQRIAIARALGCKPELVVADEAVAALDVSTRASIIGLLQDLQQETGVGYLFISHDLALVQTISDYVAVMYLGQIVEFGPTADVYSTPGHPYTRALIDAVPVPDPVVQRQKERIRVTGEIPSALNIPSGCTFRTRCPFATDLCTQQEPPRIQVGEEQFATCHYATPYHGTSQSSGVLQRTEGNS
ncbi:oligopeptide transport system ATP-binding protein [Antricoccus suffuscus]|uniref:Oligopeptide transport system ATP-binding protein n=1 Tax=Antricoccus suffuscus TaxID=1629062 RepID=A0A2T1A5Y5_9ACTN|nr:ABC transporter ATP-binding protein [Antricoccus suffuscus]PRZ44023.1 oligopeptide transport system ATP-binding protein [Antricoccus suffuscus]